MKKDRKARKELNDLYFYLDMERDSFYNKPTKNMIDKFNMLSKKFKNRFENRHFAPYEWREYYGVFEFGHDKIGIDPKRMAKTLYTDFSEKQLKVMNSRKTTYFYPKYHHKEEYYSNVFKDAIDDLINEFNKVTCPILEEATIRINKKRKEFSPGDIDLFMQGIYEYDEACMSANHATIRNKIAVRNELIDLNVSVLSQFFHYMVSRIDALSASTYIKLHPKMKKWRRDLLYDYKNLQNVDCRKLEHYDFHNKMYLIWNFIKHGDPNIYKTLKNNYPEVLFDCEYARGRPPKYYINFSDKLILDLLNGVKEYFIEWFEINLGENRDEITWNYCDYFIDLVDEEIEMLRNPLGLEF